MNDPNPVPGLATTRRRLLAAATAAFGGFAVLPLRTFAADETGLSHNAEAIHQEPVFQASRKRVYDALTDARQFEQVVRLSAAMKSMAIGAKPAEITAEPGGAFALFGGYLTGRQIELVPNERIVQAWRAASWKDGDYSIAKFVLTEQGSSTKILFDHRGFPDGTGEHLALGWRVNYWEPLEKFLATQK
jgi:activator of HSP90 ATPase